jgi:hypothetical protein
VVDRCLARLAHSSELETPVTPLRPFWSAVYVGSGYEKVRGGVYCGSVRYVGVGLKYRHYFGLCEIAIFNGFADVQRST